MAIDRVVRKWVVLWEQVPQERINCDTIGNIVVRGLVKVVKVSKVGPSPLCWNLVVLLANALISDWRKWVPTPAWGRDSLWPILYFVFCILYFVSCIMYSVVCSLYSVFCFLKDSPSGEWNDLPRWGKTPPVGSGMIYWNAPRQSIVNYVIIM